MGFLEAVHGLDDELKHQIQHLSLVGTEDES